MKLLSVFLATVCVATSFAQPTLVTREECKEDYLPDVLACIDNSTGSPDCEFLPIPDFAFPQNQVNEMGYWMQKLRGTPTSYVYAVGDNGYLSIIALDVPPEGDEDLQGDGPIEMSEDGHMVNGATLAFIDFPPTFLQMDEDGTPTGSHLISALGDILDELGASIDDIGKVEMIYTHGHKDHIGLANHTYMHVTKALGLEDITIIGSEGLKEHLQHVIDVGYSSYFAPLPTVTFESVKNHTIGHSTDVTLTTVEGHMYGAKDVVVFMEAVDEENPAIMMAVDVVFPKWVPMFDFGKTTDFLEYIRVHDVLLEFPLGNDGYIVTGHLNQVGDRNDIILNKELTMAFLEGARLALETVNREEQVMMAGVPNPGSRNFGNRWAGTGAIFDEFERVCARHVLEQYGCDFGGLDVTVYSCCNVALFFYFIDV